MRIRRGQARTTHSAPDESIDPLASDEEDAPKTVKRGTVLEQVTRDAPKTFVQLNLLGSTRTSMRSCASRTTRRRCGVVKLTSSLLSIAIDLRIDSGIVCGARHP